MTDILKRTQHCTLCTGTPCEEDALVCADLPDGVGRRTFLTKSVLMAAAAALTAACGSGNSGGNFASPSLPAGTTININTYPALANVNGIATVNVSRTSIAIVRTGTASFLALSLVCPHQGGTIYSYSGGFQCSVHGATFSQTGQWRGGQRTSNMYSYTTSFDATTGTLTIS
ncbi:MAG: Rieske 2Fe-2S domain-containing protein [Acidobacteriaceae bacterium]|jgi:Rieske Fe-S protein|nr:Rieske 2Fe-2S domain-containing protein [Acidobacteriaceae bacterium]